jgi:hypothetical protein
MGIGGNVGVVDMVEREGIAICLVQTLNKRDEEKK